MSPGIGAEFYGSGSCNDSTLPGDFEASPRARDVSSGAEHFNSGAWYDCPSPSIKVRSRLIATGRFPGRVSSS